MSDVRRYTYHGEDERAMQYYAEYVDATDYDALAAELAASREIVDRIWAIYGSPTYEALAGKSVYDLINADRARIATMESALRRAETVLANMALENPGAVFDRWPIPHEPLRADAKSVLPIVRAALAPQEPP